jgi:predicted nuclease with TOPRIM domain
MKLEDKVNQLTELMADLIPAVDRLAKNQEETTSQLSDLRIMMSELRLSNMKLAESIDRLSTKIDKIDEFQVRLERLEKIVLK